ncbi:MAG TPA: hypothetical protein VIK81_03710 [Patescibacteria group bacterium]
MNNRVIDHHLLDKLGVKQESNEKRSGFDKGFSVLGFLATVGILGSAVYLVFNFLKSEEIAGKARDGVRLSDMAIFVLATEQYFLDKSSFPDVANVTRISNVSSSNPTNVNGTGWIKVDMSKYIANLRIDPINSGIYVYKYRHDNRKYKFETVLESEKDLMKNGFDGGIDDHKYEVGNGRTQVIE